MFPAQQAAPIQNQYQPQPAIAAGPPRPGSRKKVAIIAAVVVIGGIVAIVAATAGGGKPAGGDLIDLQNQEFATVRDEICECKDEKCTRAAIARIDEIMKRTGQSGLTPSKEQREKGRKLLDEIGVCMTKVPRGAPTAGGDVVSDLVALRDAMCACKTKACADELQPKFDQWRGKYMSNFNALPADVRRQALDVAKAQKECYERATSAK